MRRFPILLRSWSASSASSRSNTIFIVDEREKAMVLQFGQVRAVKEEPGLAFKIPFIQNVVFYDSRIQGLDTNALEVTPLDDRRLIVDAFARWRIADVRAVPPRGRRRRHGRRRAAAGVDPERQRARGARLGALRGRCCRPTASG